MNTGADATTSGMLVLSTSGGRRERLPLSTKENKTARDWAELYRIYTKPTADPAAIPDLEDPLKHLWYQLHSIRRRMNSPDFWERHQWHKVGKYWYGFGDSKYGRVMVCAITGITRSLTSAEFYGGD